MICGRLIPRRFNKNFSHTCTVPSSKVYFFLSFSSPILDNCQLGHLHGQEEENNSILRGAGMAQWLKGSPSTKVAWVESWTQRYKWVVLILLLVLALLQGFFLCSTVFVPWPKLTTLNFSSCNWSQGPFHVMCHCRFLFLHYYFSIILSTCIFYLFVIWKRI